MAEGNVRFYEEHLFEALDIARSEIRLETATLLVLNVYGLRLLADPTAPNSRLREMVIHAWQDLVFARDAPPPLQVLRNVTVKVFRSVLSDRENLYQDAKQVDELADDLVVSALLQDQDVSTSLALRLVRHVEELQPFRDDADRHDFAKVLTEAVLEPSSRGWAKSASELGSRSLLRAALAEIAKGLCDQPPRSVYDPTVGTGGALFDMARALAFDMADETPPPELYGQDINAVALFAATWRLLIHDVPRFHLARGDVLLAPAFLEGTASRSMRFDIVVATPPMGLKLPKRGVLAKLESDPHDRFQYGPIPSTADWLFVQHALASTKPGGLAIVTLAPGALWRGGPEERVRKQLIAADHVSAVVLLPAGLVAGTSLQSAALVLEAKKPSGRRGRIRFVDVSAVDHGALIDSLRAAITASGDESRQMGLHVPIDTVFEHDFSLLPTPYLPPPDVRSALPPREEAEHELSAAIAALESATRRFDFAIRELGDE